MTGEQIAKIAELAFITGFMSAYKHQPLREGEWRATAEAEAADWINTGGQING